MSILVDDLPETVKIGGLSYPIDTDFRSWIRLEELLLDDAFTKQEKVELALDLIFPAPVPSFLQGDALAQIFWFYAEGKEHKLPDPEDEEEAAERIFSYEEDGGYIYAAFLEQYGLDLTKDTLHWWQFMALFKSLNPETLFVKIMGYRTMQITADMPVEKRAFYTKMKKLYALGEPKAEEKKKRTIEEALLHGGDLSGIL